MGGSTVRIGIAGLGRMGRHHATNLAQRVTGAELVAACSPVADELAWARDTLGITHGYADYARLLAHPGLDAVFLVTPTTLHADQIIAGLEAGKHVFSEKAARARSRRLPCASRRLRRNTRGRKR
jgi:myo-inositol 2-dehydrogenase/D-chiro-inositol 1-dehydrogenase